MKDRPELQLIGHDGNIFAVMGSAGGLLRRAGLHEEADEMYHRVQSCHDYYEALAVVSQYVNTELSSGGKGFIEAEDITVDRELIPDEHGVDAYIETHFDIRQRFGINLEGDDSADMYATYLPDTDTLSASLCIERCGSEQDEYLEVKLYPAEAKMLKSQMNETCIIETGKDMKELFDDWKRGNGKENIKTTNKEKIHHER